MNNFENIDILKKKFNWGAFFLTWIWGLFNNTYITLIVLPICFIPKIGSLLVFFLAIYFGMQGNKWALKNKKYKSKLSFLKNQKIIAIVGLMLHTTFIISAIIWNEMNMLYPPTVDLEMIRKQTSLLIFILCVLQVLIYIISLFFVVKISIEKEKNIS